MPFNAFSDISITGSLTIVPEYKRSIEQETELYGGNKKLIERLKKTLGLNERRIVQNSETAYDLCSEAVSRLIKENKIDVNEIGVIIFVTQTADHSQPGNALKIHGKFRFPTSCAAFDVNLGCSGFVYSLWLAFSLVSGSASSKVLVLAGDTLSRLVNPKDRSVAALFGDAGSATIVEEKKGVGNSYFSLGSNGRGFNDLIVPAGGARLPISNKTKKEFVDEEGNIRTKENLYMNGSEVFNFSIEVIPREIESLLNYARCKISEVDYFVLHQANRYMVQNICKRMNCDLDKFPVKSFEAFGNLSSVSIPGAMAYQMKEVLSSKTKQRVILSGFGVGLSWASCLLNLGKMDFLKWEEYSFK